MKKLYECYSRLLVDNHITDLKSEFMSRYNPAEFVRMIKMSGIESAMVYACDHNGNCYYPTENGHMHRGLQGWDIFGEVVKGLREADILPVAYYTVIYHNQSALDNPAWRMRDLNGLEHYGRYHFSCPNNAEYRQFCLDQIDEIIAYEPGGIFIDMTFWPMVCYCDSCRRSYGKNLPETIDWNSPEWVEFQRWREQSMADFTAFMTSHIKSRMPELPVTYQFSPVLHGWRFGQSEAMAACSDYSSGDFYGGKLQQRLGVKVFSAFSRRTPYEYMTSRCINLRDHTSAKSDDELFLHAVTTLLNGGAYFFIDAINPDGTLEEPFYRRLQKINAALEPFRHTASRLRPQLAAETGLYFSLDSMTNDRLNRLDLRQFNDKEGNMAQITNPVRDEVLGASQLLNQLHIPYKIITGQDHDFAGLKAIIIPNTRFLSAAETERLRKFVADGGTLIATGYTSLNNNPDFDLADVFGVSFSGSSTGEVNYLAVDSQMLSAPAASPLVTAHPQTTVQGQVALPDFPVNDPEQYASIHSNPPGPTTSYAGLTVNSYGKGQCIYLFSPLFSEFKPPQQHFLKQLLRNNLPKFTTKSRNLPESTEITWLTSENSSTRLLGIVNYQEELPNIPLNDVEFTFRLPESFAPSVIRRASDGQEFPCQSTGGLLTLKIPYLQNAELFELKEI